MTRRTPEPAGGSTVDVRNIEGVARGPQAHRSAKGGMTRMTAMSFMRGTGSA